MLLQNSVEAKPIDTQKELAKGAEMTNTGLQKSVNPIIKVDTQKEKNLHLSQGSGVKGTQNSADVNKGETRQELAKIAGVSHDTIAKVEKIEQKATPEIKTQLQTGEISINQAYKTGKKEEIAFVQMDKSYISEQPKTTAPEKPKTTKDNAKK